MIYVFDYNGVIYRAKDGPDQSNYNWPLIEFLQKELSSAIKVIYTNGFVSPQAKQQLTQSGFSHVITAPYQGYYKSQPEGYQQLAKDLQTATGNVYFVDDTPQNVHAAQAVGVRAVFFSGTQALINNIRSIE